MLKTNLYTGMERADGGTSTHAGLAPNAKHTNGGLNILQYALDGIHLKT